MTRGAGSSIAITPNGARLVTRPKYYRMIGFAKALPKIRRRTLADLRRPGLCREKVLALIVQLLEKTLIRVGNDEYAKQNRSFGLTTLRDGHVNVQRGRVTFTFRGKSGVEHDDRTGRSPPRTHRESLP